MAQKAWNNHEILPGIVYNSLTLTGEFYIHQFKSAKAKFVECICICGSKKYFRYAYIRSGHTKSCGCTKGEIISRSRTVHGFARRSGKHPLYLVLRGMKARCYNKKEKAYKDYGGRGIQICDEWRHDFVSFYNWAIKNGYNEGLEIERIDNDKNYEPNNCIWATALIQNRNKRDNLYLEAFGERKCLSAWSEDKRCIVKRGTLHTRVTRQKWDPERAITTKAWQHQKIKHH